MECTLAEMMADYALDLAFEDLPEPVVDAGAAAMADTLACAVGAVGEEGPELLRDFAGARRIDCWSRRLSGATSRSICRWRRWSIAAWRAISMPTISTPGRRAATPGHFSDAIPGAAGGRRGDRRQRAGIHYLGGGRL